MRNEALMEQLCLVCSHVSELIIDAFSSYSSMPLQSISERRCPPCLHSCLSIIAPHSITLCHWTRTWLTVFRIHSAVIQSVCCSVHPLHMLAPIALVPCYTFSFVNNLSVCWLLKNQVIYSGIFEIKLCKCNKRKPQHKWRRANRYGGGKQWHHAEIITTE